MLLTWYLAGMYRYLPLMALCGMELLLIAASYILVRIFRKKLTITFPTKSREAFVGEVFSCKLSAHYGGRLPISCFRLRIKGGYAGEKRRKAWKIYGSLADGKEEMEFTVMAQYCGMIQFRIEKLKLYDYFSLFSVKKKLGEEMQVAVFPKEWAMQIKWQSKDWEENLNLQEQFFPGDTSQEIYQVREYRYGDSNRHIHWNLSARSDDLFIKEYCREEGAGIFIFLDLVDKKKLPLEQLSSFYTLFFSLVMGLLAKVQIVWVCFGGQEAAVHNEKECREFLFMLYQADDWKENTMEDDGEKEMMGQGAFLLNGDLQLFWDQKLIFQFSTKNLEQEIREKVFVL